MCLDDNGLRKYDTWPIGVRHNAISGAKDGDLRTDSRTECAIKGIPASRARRGRCWHSDSLPAHAHRRDWSGGLAVGFSNKRFLSYSIHVPRSPHLFIITNTASALRPVFVRSLFIPQSSGTQRWTARHTFQVCYTTFPGAPRTAFSWEPSHPTAPTAPHPSTSVRCQHASLRYKATRCGRPFSLVSKCVHGEHVRLDANALAPIAHPPCHLPVNCFPPFYSCLHFSVVRTRVWPTTLFFNTDVGWSSDLFSTIL